MHFKIFILAKKREKFPPQVEKQSLPLDINLSEVKEYFNSENFLWADTLVDQKQLHKCLIHAYSEKSWLH